jgi:FlaA1/EpsC-like NDP-sugar epimerase
MDGVLETRQSGTSFSEQIARGLQVIFDFLVVLTSSMVCWVVVLSDKEPEFFQRYLLASLVSGLAVTATMGYSRMYDFDVVTEPQAHLRSMISSMVITFLGLLFLSFSLGHSDAAFSRIWAYSFFASAVLLLILERFIWAGIIHRMAQRGMISRNVAIIGGGEHAVMLLRSLTGQHNPWVRIVGIFDDRHRRNGRPLEGHVVQGGMPELLQLAKMERIDDIFVALPWKRVCSRSLIVFRPFRPISTSAPRSSAAAWSVPASCPISASPRCV